MPLFEVAIIAKKTKEVPEEVVLRPWSVIAKNQDEAKLKATMEHASELQIFKHRDLEILCRNF